MYGSHQSLIDELKVLHGLQQRIDRVAGDLNSGDRRYAEVDAKELGELLGIEFGSCVGWGMGRGWALRRNMPGVDFSPEAKREFRWTERFHHYSLYEAQAEEALFTPVVGLQEFMGWCSLLTMCKSVTSSSGFHFSFRQITDGVHFEAISPYIDGIAVDETELFQLRFVVASEAIGDSLGTDSPYFPEPLFDEDEVWPLRVDSSVAELSETKSDPAVGILPYSSACFYGVGV